MDVTVKVLRVLLVIGVIVTIGINRPSHQEIAPPPSSIDPSVLAPLMIPTQGPTPPVAPPGVRYPLLSHLDDTWVHGPCGHFRPPGVIAVEGSCRIV